MVRILVLVSVPLAALVASCLFDHQTRPPRTAKRTTDIRSPFGFIGYLLFHQVAMPKPTTAGGKMTTLSQNTMLSFCAVRVRGLSSGAFGRIEMRSSSEESQFTMLPKRSRLPSWRDAMRLLEAQNEVPVTIRRPCVPPRFTAAPRVSGPFLPFLGSIAPPAGTPVTETLSSPVPNSFVALPPPAATSNDRVTGKALGTPRERGAVIGWDSYDVTR